MSTLTLMTTWTEEGNIKEMSMTRPPELEPGDPNYSNRMTRADTGFHFQLDVPGARYTGFIKRGVSEHILTRVTWEVQ